MPGGRPLLLDAEPGSPAPNVLATLVENRTRFLAFLERRLGGRDAAEEVLQEAYARGIDRRTSLKDGESAVAWFYRLLRNILVDRHRKAQLERRAVEGIAAEPPPASPLPDHWLMQQVCSCAGALLDTLKPEYADVLRKVDLRDVELRAFAAEAGITTNNAGVRLHRAREALRRQLARVCGASSVEQCLDCACS